GPLVVAPEALGPRALALRARVDFVGPKPRLRIPGGVEDRPALVLPHHGPGGVVRIAHRERFRPRAHEGRELVGIELPSEILSEPEGGGPCRRTSGRGP